MKIVNKVKGLYTKISTSKYKHIAGFMVFVFCVGLFGGFGSIGGSKGYDGLGSAQYNDMAYVSDSIQGSFGATKGEVAVGTNSFNGSFFGSSEGSGAAPESAVAPDYNYNDYDMVETEDTYLSTEMPTVETREEKLIYSADLQIETKDIDVALESIYAKIKEYGGIIQNESQNNMGNVVYEDYYRYSPNASAYIFVRIPQEHYETFINNLEDKEGQIVVSDISKSVENMTEVYYDQESRLRSLRVQEERLFEFMETAVSVTEMLEVEDRLTDVQYEIDTATNVLNEIDNDVRYSKVRLNIEEVLKYTEVEENPKNFIERVWSYIKGSADNFVDTLEEWLEFAIYFIPYLVVLVIVYVVFIKVKRKIQAKRKLKNNSDNLDK